MAATAPRLGGDVDLWRLELPTADQGDLVLATRALEAIGATVGWTHRATAGGSAVASVDLRFRVDPPAVTRALREAGLPIARLGRLPLAHTSDLGTRRIA